MAIPTFTDGNALPASQLNSLGSYTTPTGAVVAFAGATAPTNYLLCDGAAVSRTTYAELFTVLSTTYGAGDGSTTFNVPNLKGRAVVGLDASQTEFDARGETGGAKTVALSTAELPVHSHSQNNFGVATVASGSLDSNGFVTGGAAADRQGGGRGNGNTGSGSAHNNLQPYIVLNYIIKT